MNVGDRITITVVAVPETGAKDEQAVCNECVYMAIPSCVDMNCCKADGIGEDVIFVPEEVADAYIVRALERRME